MRDPTRLRRGPGQSSTEAVLEDDNLLTEILLRLPPRPSSLPQASRVCTRWRRITSHPAFFRLFRLRHGRAPPLLGFFEKQGRHALFKPALDAPDCIPSERFSLTSVVGDTGSWNVLGCRHGRLLAVNRTTSKAFVFRPVSGDLRVIDAPAEFTGPGGDVINGAVLCDNDDDDLFKVILVGIADQHAMARIYSSETGAWGNLISTEEPCAGYLSRPPATLVANSLYWWLHNSADGILEFDLDEQKLHTIMSPPVANISSGRSRIIRGENGCVGFALLSWPSFQLWDRNVDTTWVLRKTVKMHEILGLESRIAAVGMATILAYSEEAHTVLVSVREKFFMVQLESMETRKLNVRLLENTYYPFSDFYPFWYCEQRLTVSAQTAAPAIEAP